MTAPAENANRERSASVSVPAYMRALVLDGVGFGHLQVQRVRTPRPGPRQMLARVDAAGICTSLIKLVEQGPDHKQLYGWDLERFPLILGDEGSVTLVEVGQELKDRYHPGERYVIQPAVDHPPINHPERYRDGGRGVAKVGVGYTLPGHLAEYVLVTEETVAAGCLLPVRDAGFPFAHAAMSEPLSCCVSAQDHHVHLLQETPLGPRQVIKGLKPGGVTVVIGAGAMGRMHVDLALSYRPRAMVVADLLEARLELVRTLLGPRASKAGIDLEVVNPGTTDLNKLVNQLTNYSGADDVIVAVGSKKAIESAQSLVGRGAVLDLFGGLKKGEEVIGLDTGIVHYKEINVTGSSGGSPWDIARTLELMLTREIDAGCHITRIGDLEHSIEFLRMVMAQEIDGKAVVYPHRRTAEIRAVKSWSGQDEREYLTGC
ncbi:MAG: zinc-binding dehydrogenase [Terriglobia bacterium]